MIVRSWSDFYLDQQLPCHLLRSTRICSDTPESAQIHQIPNKLWREAFFWLRSCFSLDLLHSSQFTLVKRVRWLNWLQLEASFSQRAGMWDGGLPSLSAGEVSSEQCRSTERVLSISKRSKFYISIEILYWACSICYQECISCCCSENAKLFGKENFPYSEAAFFSSILWQNQTEGKVSLWKYFPKVVSGNPS